MVDERLLPNKPNANFAKLSKWIRKGLRSMCNYENFIDELTKFVSSMQELDLKINEEMAKSKNSAKIF